MYLRDLPLHAAGRLGASPLGTLPRRAALLRAKSSEADARDELLEHDRELVVRGGRGRAHCEDQLLLHDVQLSLPWRL